MLQFVFEGAINILPCKSPVLEAQGTGLTEGVPWNKGLVIFNGINGGVIAEKVPSEIRYNNDVERGTNVQLWCMHGQRMGIYFKLLQHLKNKQMFFGIKKAFPIN